MVGGYFGESSVGEGEWSGMVQSDKHIVGGLLWEEVCIFTEIISPNKKR